MKLSEYPITPIQEGDYVFGYRDGIDGPGYRFSGVPFSSTGQLAEYSVSVTLNRTDVLALNTIGYTLITPPSGYGVQTISPIGMVVNSAGTPFVFGVNQTLDILNNAVSANTIAQFDRASVVTNPISSAAMGYAYEVVVNGAVRVTATAAITGGGVSATMTLLIKYRLLSIT